MSPVRSHPTAKARACLLAALIGLTLALLACSSSGAKNEAKASVATSTPEATATVTATPSPEPVFEPPVITPTEVPTEPTTPVPTPIDAPQIQLLPAVIGQGQTTYVSLAGNSAASATALYDGRRYPLVAQGGSFWGIIAAAGDADPGPHTIVIQLFDADANLLTELQTQVTVVSMDFPVENIDLPDDVNNSLDPALIQQEDDARANTFALFTPQKLWAGAFIWPVPEVIVSPFGIRRSYNGGPVSSFHGGIDLAADAGVPVAAANSGRVAYVGSGPTHGNSVLIDHGDGVFSGYNHLSAINVTQGQMVNKGEIVGLIGSTGMATGPHLHWEVVVRGVLVDPAPWTLQEMGP